MSRLSRWYWPVACYLGLSLGVPALNGGMQNAEFGSHVLGVLGGAVGVLAVLLVMEATARRLVAWAIQGLARVRRSRTTPNS